MVNNCGHWTYEPYTPTDKKCWLDLIADWITSTGYKVETTIENTAIMITSHQELEIEDRENEEFPEDHLPCAADRGAAAFGKAPY